MVQNAESIVKLYSTYITKLYEIVLNINILGRDSAERRLDVIVTAVGSIPNRKNWLISFLIQFNSKLNFKIFKNAELYY